MSLHLPARRLLRPAAAVRRLLASTTKTTTSVSSMNIANAKPINSQQIRSIFAKKDDKKGSKAAFGKNLSDLENNPELRKSVRQRLAPRVEGGIFGSEIAEAEAERAEQIKAAAKGGSKFGARSEEEMASMRDQSVILPEWKKVATDPDPRARVRWERKKVIQMLHNENKRPTRAERIRQTERQITLKSPWLSTSTKKLVHLAHQVAGKTLDEALVQMQFSKKKWAEPIHDHLVHGRDVAIAKAGMGLGESKGEAPLKKPLRIETKDGKRLNIVDPTRMYIEQAWVNRGKYFVTRLFRMGRGRRSTGRTATSSITVVLKEEKTRIREHNDREAKTIRAKPWIQLPDKPIMGQRPYYSW